MAAADVLFLFTIWIYTGKIFIWGGGYINVQDFCHI